MFMPNIPRRKVMETILRIEDIILKIEEIFEDKNFEKKKDDINLLIPIVIDDFNLLKIYIVHFLSKKHFDTEKDYRDEIVYFLKNKTELDSTILDNKSLSKSLRNNFKELNDLLVTGFKFESFANLQSMHKKLDILDSEIVKLLEKGSSEIKLN